MTPTTEAELLAADAARDVAVCGRSLALDRPTRWASAGAHDPTPTPYFVLEELIGDLGLTADDHLLDVGCGQGRALAYVAEAGLPCRATGVELDPELAAVAMSWTVRFPRLSVACGSVLDLPLAPYTHFYLFNPFDTAVLTAFLDKLEHEARGPVTLVHMSDNGESFAYLGRPGWSLVRQGSFQDWTGAPGARVRVYDWPQHFSVRRFDPAVRDDGR